MKLKSVLIAGAITVVLGASGCAMNRPTASAYRAGEAAGTQVVYDQSGAKHFKGSYQNAKRSAGSYAARSARTNRTAPTPYQYRANGSYSISNANRSGRHLTGNSFNIVNAPANTRGYRSGASAIKRNAVTPTNRDGKMGIHSTNVRSTNNTGATRKVTRSNTNTAASTKRSNATTHKNATTRSNATTHKNATTRSNTAKSVKPAANTAKPATTANTAQTHRSVGATNTTQNNTTRSTLGGAAANHTRGNYGRRNIHGELIGPVRATRDGLRIDKNYNTTRSAGTRNATRRYSSNGELIGPVRATRDGLRLNTGNTRSAATRSNSAGVNNTRSFRTNRAGGYNTRAYNRNNSNVTRGSSARTGGNTRIGTNRVTNRPNNSVVNPSSIYNGYNYGYHGYYGMNDMYGADNQMMYDGYSNIPYMNYNNGVSNSASHRVYGQNDSYRSHGAPTRRSHVANNVTGRVDNNVTGRSTDMNRFNNNVGTTMQSRANEIDKNSLGV